MKRADLSDAVVVRAALDAHASIGGTTLERLIADTDAPEKVALAAIERAARRGFVQWGVSVGTAWPTAAGLALLTAGGA